MKVEKKRLNVKLIRWNADDGVPMWQDWYGCEKREFERWLGVMTRRFKGDWKRARLELSWKDGNKPRYVGPKLRKEYNHRFKYRWSRELIMGKIEEMRNDGVEDITSTALAWKMGLNVRWMMVKLKKYGIVLHKGLPRGLYGRPLSVPIYVNRR